MRGSWDNLHLTGEETEGQSTWVKHQTQGEDTAELGVKPSPAAFLSAGSVHEDGHALLHM